MKRLLSMAILLLLLGCGEKSREAVDIAATEIDPTKIELESASTAYSKRKFLDTGIETGMITLGDGETVRYWFQSHHHSDDIGCTRFQFSDGSVRYLHGGFCCEVELPKEQIASRAELAEFIADKDGLAP